MQRMVGWRRIAAALAVSLALLGARPSGALPTSFLVGFDMDSDTSGLNTQAGFQAVTTCTFVPGETPVGCIAPLIRFGPTSGVGAGYLGDRHPFTATLFTPGASSSEPNLWKDAHSVAFEGIAGELEPVLRIYGLEPGTYEVVLLSHSLAADARTAFSINGSPVGEIVGVAMPADLWAEQTLTVPVTVGSSGAIDIAWKNAVPKQNSGHLNGVVIVPEPRAATLVDGSLLLALAVVLGRGRRAAGRA
jgi:hypothetical protein